MVAGRPPVPNERKRKLGNPGRRPLPDDASVTAVEGVLTAVPAHLGPEGRRVYERVVQGAVWLAESDGPMKLLACAGLPTAPKQLYVMIAERAARILADVAAD